MAKVKGLPQAIKVPILGGEVVAEVKKLPLGKAASLSMALKDAPGQLTALLENPEIKDKLSTNTSDAEFALAALGILPDALTVATDLVVNLLAVGTDLETEVIEQCGLDEASELLLAILTVNNIEVVQGNFQKIKDLLKPKKKK